MFTTEQMDRVEALFTHGQDIMLTTPEHAEEVVDLCNEMLTTIMYGYVLAPTEWYHEELEFLDRVYRLGLMLGSDLIEPELFLQGIQERRSHVIENPGHIGCA